MSRILYIQKYNKSPSQKTKDVHRDGQANEKRRPVWMSIEMNRVPNPTQLNCYQK